MRNETLLDLITGRSYGKNLRELAEAASIGRASIWRWTSGLSLPRHAQASALAATLGVSVDRVLAAAKESQKRKKEQRRRKARRAAKKKELHPT